MPEGFLAFIMPLSSGGGRPDQGLPMPPPTAGWGPGFPTNPIAPGGPPPVAGWGPGFPTNPIAPGGQPPIAGWGPGFPTNPIAPGGLPPYATTGPGFPTNPIAPGGLPPYATTGPGFPSLPIYIPPSQGGGETPAQPVNEPPTDSPYWQNVYIPGVGWVWAIVPPQSSEGEETESPLGR